VTTPAELASELGFGEEYGVLRRFVLDLGNPTTSALRRLPEGFLRTVLGVEDTESNEDLDAGLMELRRLVRDSPQEEAERLVMAFNFEHSSGKVTWTQRARKFAEAKKTNESQIRKKVDNDLLLLLIRTKTAAEKRPEVPAPAHLVAQGSRVAEFFDEGYVRNSREFESAWATATTVDVTGFGHNRMLVSYSSEIKALLTRGARMRVLLQDPDGEAILHANFRSSTPKASPEDARDQQRIGLATLAALRKGTGSTSLEVRSFDIAPPFTAYFFDGETDLGVAFVWFWSWRQSSSERPGFVVRKSQDALWFHRFYSQFTDLWTDDEVTTPVVLGA